MPTVLRWLPMSALLLTACGEQAYRRPVGTEPLPGVAAQSSTVLPGAQVPASLVPGSRSCLTRYDFEANFPDAECATDVVDGDPLHWITMCPVHDLLTEETEILIDESGRLLFSAEREPDRTWSRTLIYDDLGRLVEVRFNTENELTGDRVMTFTEFTADGQPLHMVIAGDDWVIDEQTIPAGNQYGSYEYDALGRLVHHEVRFTVNDSLFYRYDIEYDDAAGRRTWDVLIDTSGVDPRVPPPGPGPQNGGSELFDEENRMFERHWFRPGVREDEPETFLSGYRYDEDGRLLDTAFEADFWGSSRDYRYTSHEVYDCP